MEVVENAAFQVLPLLKWEHEQQFCTHGHPPLTPPPPPQIRACTARWCAVVGETWNLSSNEGSNQKLCGKDHQMHEIELMCKATPPSMHLNYITTSPCWLCWARG